MNYLGIYFLIMLPALSSAFLNYDRAIVAGQKNNWAASAELLKTELIQNPESAQLLYDTGVSSYKNGDYDYALSYFLKASESSQAPALLQEQALFNAGNTQVALKQLENALNTFEKVLEKNPKNAKASHNKEIVKKMLEEQKQQQDQNKDTNKNEKQDKKENNEQNQKEQNKDQQQENKDQKNDQKKNDSSEKEKKEQEQKFEQEKQSQENKQSSDQKKDAQEQSETQNRAQSSPKEEQSNPEQQLSPNMARMLDEREKKDAQLNKQLMRVMAGAQNAGADHHEHYW